MHLTHRPAERNDLTRCIALLRHDPTLSQDLLPYLPQFWLDRLAQDALIMSVVEDHERAATARIVSFGATLFVSDRFVEEAKSSRPPNISVQAIQEEIAGNGPALSSAGVREANAGDGLNALVIHNMWDRENLTPDEARATRDETIKAFLHEHQGYRLKQILLERCGEEALRRVLTGGFRLYRDFTEYYKRQDIEPPPADLHPYLCGLSREEAREAEGSTVAPLFIYTEPRFRFRPVDQSLLRRAVLGETDEELAASLEISASAVKKRWAAIFEHSSSVAPDLFPRAKSRSDETERKRGAEKRSRLLAYLRHHPEDLRPH